MNYRGYKESDEVCEWLSKIFQLDVMLIRAEPDRLMKLDLDRFAGANPNDRRAGFLTDGAIHLCNNQSM